MSNEVIEWWKGRLDSNELMKAFFAKTWTKLGARIEVLFPDRVRDLYYSAGRLAGLEAQREYFKIGEQTPPGDFKGIIEFITMALERLIVPFGEIEIAKLYKLFLDEEAIIEIKENPYASGMDSEEPACYYLRGFIESIMEYLTDYNRIDYETLEIEEETCMAMGDEACSFHIKMSYPPRG
ncbi:MAG: 4-vinyl reductase [Candidatus Thorarchaeota archaeon]|nr:4-vinyl reductase [Candidatus Thorarchaeota archaeon]